MNRFLFVFFLVLALISGRVMLFYDVPGYGFILLGLGTIITSFRRVYLGLKPRWGGTPGDIFKYFKEP